MKNVPLRASSQNFSVKNDFNGSGHNWKFTLMNSDFEETNSFDQELLPQAVSLAQGFNIGANIARRVMHKRYADVNRVR
jgi:hypothetical protein